MISKGVFLTIVLIFFLCLFSGCEGPEGPPGIPGPEGPPGEINYWIHTILSSEVSYISGSPYGYYDTLVYDDRIGPDMWVDVWTVAANGSIFRRASYFDETLGVWYWIIYLYEGAFAYRSVGDETGISLVIFYAPATAKGLQDFDALEFWKELNRMNGRKIDSRKSIKN